MKQARCIAVRALPWSLLLLCAANTKAMVVVKRDFPELVARAEQIVVGTVSGIRHERDESGTPITLVTLSDLTVLKGDVGATFTVRFSGGPADGVEVHVADMPRFAIGERDVLFVAGNGRDICPLVGVWQGRFRARFDPVRGPDMVEHSDGSPVTQLDGRELGRARRRAGASPPEAMPLDAFRRLIVDELAHPQSGSEPLP